MSTVRRYDQTSLLAGLSLASTGWDSSIRDDSKRIKRFYPWDVLGAAAVVLCRGSNGSKKPTPEDVAWICHLYSNLDHPGAEDESFGLQLISRFIYQQWPLQRPGEEAWARTVALYGETSFKPEFEPRVMTDEWAEELFGCSIHDFVSVGFILYSAANQGSHYPFPWDPELLQLLEGLGGRERFHAIAERNFFTSVGEIKERRKAAVDALDMSPGQAYLREPFTFNPLVSRPFVAGIFPGRHFAPSASAVQLRCSVAGIIFAGLEKWGNRFTDEAGLLFEEYIGRNLAGLEGAQCLPEIAYKEGKQSKKSVDWIVVTPTAVLLVECKNSMPTADIREGREGLLDSHKRRLSKAIEQINTTARLINSQQPEFQHIPSNLPIFGLVATLEPFELANTPEVRSQLPTASVPVGVVGPDAIEFLSTVGTADQIELFSKLESFTSEGNILRTNDWLATTEGTPNPVLMSAFENIPVIAYVKDLKEA